MPRTWGYPAGGEKNYAFYVSTTLPMFGFVANPADNVKLCPLAIPWTMTVDRICLPIRNSAGNIRCAIYRDNGGLPDGGALIVESASVAVAVNKLEVTIADTLLTPGLYWLAYNNSSDLVSVQTIGAIGVGGVLTTRSYALAFGAFTDPCPVTAASSIVAQMMIRVVP